VLRAARQNEGDRRREMRRAARVGDVGQLVEEQLEVRPVVLAVPAQYAEKTPGAPPRASTQMPESSASRQPRVRRGGARDERVLGEGHAVLDGSGPS
jgi:hypothetical protein